MPKITKAGGPSYEGHVDVSSPDTAAPEWQPAAAPAEPQTAAEPVAEPEPAVEDKPEPKPSRRRR
jgi:hypothetical protein